MIFPCTPRRTDKGFGVFPRTATHTLLFKTVRVFLGSLVLELGVKVVHGLNTCFGIDGTGPLGYITCHVVEAIAVGGIDTHTAGDEVAVLGIVATVGLEVGIEAAIAVLDILVLPGEFVTGLAACGILPLGFGGQAITLDEAGFAAQALEQIVGAPGTEGVGLLPGDANDGVIVVGGIAEVVAEIHLVVRVLEVVDPDGGVGIDIDDIGIEEIPRTAERAVDGLAHDIAVVVDIRRVLGNHHHLVGIDGDIGVQVALVGHEAVTAQGGSGIVVNLILIVELAVVEQLLAGHGVGDIHALDGALLVLIGLAGQRLAPVDMGSDWLAILVLGNHVGLVAGIGGVGKTRTEDRVLDILHKLLVLGVGNLGFVHPEPVDRDVLDGSLHTPERVLTVEAHVQRAALYLGHTVRRGLGKGAATNANHLAAAAARDGTLATETACQRHRERHKAEGYNAFILHLYIIIFSRFYAGFYLSWSG